MTEIRIEEPHRLEALNLTVWFSDLLFKSYGENGDKLEKYPELQEPLNYILTVTKDILLQLLEGRDKEGELVIHVEEGQELVVTLMYNYASKVSQKSKLEDAESLDTEDFKDLIVMFGRIMDIYREK